MAFKLINKIWNFHRFYILGLWVLILTILVGGTSINRVNDDENLAREGGDRFFSKYKNTLALGPIFNENGSSLTVTELRETKFFEGLNFDPKLMQCVDDDIVRRAYVAFVNAYQIGILYSYQFPKKDDGSNNIIIPDDLGTLLKNARLRKIVISIGGNESASPDNEKKNKYLVATEADIEEFISLNNEIATMFRKHLPEKPFENSVYKKRLEEFSQYQGEIGVSKTNFSEPKMNRPVYIVHRDFFTLYIVKEGGEMKILKFGIGH